MRRFRRAPVLLVIAAVSLSGCAAPLPFKYDFKKIFAAYRTSIAENPVIIIPGMSGSRLVNTETGKMVWGGLSFKQIAFLSERDDIALPIDRLPLSQNLDNIVSQGILSTYELPVEIVPFKVYRDLLEMFTGIGYVLGDIKNPKPGDNLYVFDYDWRRDNVENAIILAKRIERIKEAAGKPDEKFTLLAHSMGCVLARYYLRYGGNDVLMRTGDFEVTWEGARNVKRAILVGAPNLGSMPVFEFLHSGLDLQVVEFPPYILFTMPSIYQILPYRDLDSFIDEKGSSVDIDIYDIDNWKKYGWSIYSEKMETYFENRYKTKFRDGWKERLELFRKKRDVFVKAALKRAVRFQESLNFRPAAENPSILVLFGGGTEWTIDKAVVKQENGGWRTYFWDPRLKERLLMPGDSIVTRESLLGSSKVCITKKGWQDSPMDISFSLFVPHRHENIHKDATFQDNLLNIILGN